MFSRSVRSTFYFSGGHPADDTQACHAAYDIIDENAIYTCTGTPHPKDIERVVESMMSDEFGTSFSRELGVRSERK
jgi:replication factor C subunit 3/5